MKKASTAKAAFLFCLVGGASLVAADGPPPADPQKAKQINTLMCTSESCDGADEQTPGCKQYTTPLNQCYNAKNLFPNDPSWSEFDIFDEMRMKNLHRTFYKSTDGSCAGREESTKNIVPQPVDEEDDSFILPLDTCVGPFGPPRPWGKFSLVSDDGDSGEGETLSVE